MNFFRREFSEFLTKCQMFLRYFLRRGKCLQKGFFGKRKNNSNYTLYIGGYFFGEKNDFRKTKKYRHPRGVYLAKQRWRGSLRWFNLVD